MGQTVTSCPHSVTTYEKAKQIYENVKPIRGLSPEVRPLGARRYHHTYSVRKREDGAIEFVLYKTPVVTYLPDNTVELRSGGWMSASTFQFINRIVGVSFRVQKGCCLMEHRLYRLIVKFGQNDIVTFKSDECGRLQYADPVLPVYGYKINRAEANNVRATFKEFAQYLHGFVSLRKATITKRWYSSTREIEAVTFSMDEISMFESKGQYEPFTAVQTLVADSVLNLVDFAQVLQTPREGGRAYRPHTPISDRSGGWDRYVRVTDYFVNLIRSDQSEETKTENFHKAAIILCLGTEGVSTQLVDGLVDAQVNEEIATKRLQDFLYRKFAHRILKRGELAPGVPPNHLYEKWVNPQLHASQKI